MQQIVDWPKTLDLGRRYCVTGPRADIFSPLPNSWRRSLWHPLGGSSPTMLEPSPQGFDTDFVYP